jgi:hypothetical protein
MMKYLKWFAFLTTLLLGCWFFVLMKSIGHDFVGFLAAGSACVLAFFFLVWLPLEAKYRQPMATAKSGGWEPPRNWNHRPDGMKRPEPPPGPPNRVDRAGVFIAQPTPKERNGVGFWDLPRTWPDAEDAVGAGLAWARQGVIQEKQDLDRRAKSLSNFIGLSEAFDRLDPVEQDLLRHQCEHMWSYSEVLGARIANWRDGGGK